MLVDDICAMYMEFGFPTYVLHNFNSHNFIHKKAKAQDKKKIFERRDVTSISFPWNKGKAKKNKLKAYLSKTRTKACVRIRMIKIHG